LNAAEILLRKYSNAMSDEYTTCVVYARQLVYARKVEAGSGDLSAPKHSIRNENSGSWSNEKLFASFVGLLCVVGVIVSGLVPETKWARAMPDTVEEEEPKVWNPNLRLAAEQASQQQIVQVGAGNGWALHAFALKFRDGTVNRDDQGRDLDNWRDISSPVVAVFGHDEGGIFDPYLCYDIALELSSGEVIRFESGHEEWRGKKFHYAVPPGSLLTNVQFDGRGKCTGIECTEPGTSPDLVLEEGEVEV
jgi:hypothetical protein